MHYSDEEIARARETDLLTYLQNYEPDNLVHISGKTYCTKEHDSLKISNGRWYWFSRGFGGVSALDYLTKVKGESFQDAMRILLDDHPTARSVEFVKPKKENVQKSFELPKKSYNPELAVNYLESRGIDSGIIKYCIETNRLYESYPRHNVIFVGFDTESTPKYAMQRGCGTDFIGEVYGSDKRFSFSIPTRKAQSNGGKTLYIFESPIDLLSFATLVKMEGYDWRSVNMLSLGGISAKKHGDGRDQSESHTEDVPKMPAALEQYLSDHPEIDHVITRLDNDERGRAAADEIGALLTERGIRVSKRLPPKGKDYNDCLCITKGLTITHRSKPDKQDKNPQAVI